MLVREKNGQKNRRFFVRKMFYRDFHREESPFIGSNREESPGAPKAISAPLPGRPVPARDVLARGAQGGGPNRIWVIWRGDFSRHFYAPY